MPMKPKCEVTYIYNECLNHLTVKVCSVIEMRMMFARPFSVCVSGQLFKSQNSNI